MTFPLDCKREPVSYAALLGCCFLWIVLCLSGCTSQSAKDGPPHYYVDVSKIPNAVPRKLPRSAYGNPVVYVVEGRRYHVLKSSYGYFKRGMASWYGTKFHGRPTSSREPYDLYGMTAASTDLPIPSFVQVTNLENQKSVIVKVNDRGPFASNRIIDLSYAAAVKLGYAGKGTAMVEVKAVHADDDLSHFSPLRLAAKSTAVKPITVKPQIKPKNSHSVYLQLGVFRNLHNAEYLQTRLHTFLHERVVILSGFYHSSHLYRVLVGPLMGAGEPQRIQMQLKKMGLSPGMTVLNS